jgi:hypothetical protein
VRSSTRAYIIAAAVLALSLGIKVAVSPAWAGHATPPPRAEVLRRFLAASTVGRIEPIVGPASQAAAADGWRFQSGACQVAAFPSGPRGTLDLGVKSHARRRDRIAYVYRGELRTTPPTWTLATDVILYHLTSMIRPANEPGYVVLIYPADCAAPLALPWARLPIS